MKQALMMISVWLSLVFVSGLSHAQEQEFLPVDQAFSFSIKENNSRLNIRFDIADHYYLYLSRISLKQDGANLPFIFTPEPVEKEDEYFGVVKIFKHSVDIQTVPVSNSPISMSFQGCAEAGLCYPMQKRTIPFNSAAPENKAKQVDSEDVNSIAAFLQSGSLIWQMFIFFALGVGLAFTPCVFPMIPILSSIIVGQGSNLTTRKAFVMSLTYVLSMAFTYALAGVLVGYFGAKANIQLYLQNPWVISTFAGVFVVLSLSMFGFYELQLPRSIQDKLNQFNQNQQGGHLISVAIMGALSALVVSPCVSAPLAGTLVYISTTGDALLGGAALLALGLGMGLPLLLIGTGGSHFLPKAGGWMNNVKSVFGVTLLAVAIWLLERIIPASINMLLWSFLLIGTGVYLGAFEPNTQGWSRLFKALGLSAVLYGALLMIGMASGQTNPFQPLAPIQSVSTQSENTTASNSERTSHAIVITTKAEYDEQLKLADKNNQLMVLDFYADWCIACKIMDAEIFSQQDIIGELKNARFVQLDMTKNSDEQLELLDSFGLFGPPAVLFFRKKQEISELRIVGEVEKRSFIKSLKQAKRV